MSYYYKGKRYTKKQSPVKRAVKRVASRAWQSIQGGHLDGHREPEHYVEQTMREVQSKLDDAGEKGKDEAK